eukprot:188672-Pyramimonas_sp.AAC.1
MSSAFVIPLYLRSWWAETSLPSGSCGHTSLQGERPFEIPQVAWHRWRTVPAPSALFNMSQLLSHSEHT